MISRWIIVSILFLGCSGKIQHVSEKELKAYVTDPRNGLLKSTVTGGTVIEVIYRPRDLIIAQNAGTGMVLWMEEERKLDSLDYFVLRLSRNGGEIQSALASDAVKFNRAIAYLSGGIQNDIYLLSGSVTFAPEQVIFVPTFGSAGATSVMLVFRSSLSARSGDFSIVFEDAVFGTGSNEFVFSSDRIRSVPRLKRLDSHG